MTIRKLDQVVADAIGAGEVIERPAAVLKELLENSLDAGATALTIEIEGMGAEKIKVVDNGSGIKFEEMGLAFTRHATSKLENIKDLERISSLGFRGEGLASIGAVSRVICKSFIAGAAHGGMVKVEYGGISETEIAPPVPETSIEVRGLFENTPARRNFMKKPATEISQMVKVATALGLAHPEVSVRMSIDNKRVLFMPGIFQGSDHTVDSIELLKETFVSVYPNILIKNLLKVEGYRGLVKIEGVIAEPDALRRSRDHLYLSVNGRPVVHRGLSFAVEQAYKGLVSQGNCPVGRLNITVPFEMVDVNIHPTKREVRFKDERAVFGIIQETCFSALRSSSAYMGEKLLGDQSSSEMEMDLSPVLELEGIQHRVSTSEISEVISLDLNDKNDESPIPGKIIRGPFFLIGQLMDSYILAEGPLGLVIVDQHATHERVIFNQLVEKRERARDNVELGKRVQPLLIPRLLKLTASQMAVLVAGKEELLEAGLEIEEFGPGMARLIGYDPLLRENGLDRLVLDVLDLLAADIKDIDLSRKLERITYTVACQSAIKFGQKLSREEMESLLRDLEVADPGITCPHGRPTMLDVTEFKLRREFKRSQA